MENNMSEYDQILLENEREVNKLMAALGKKLLLLIPAMFLLWLLGILYIELPQLIATMIVTGITFFMPVVAPKIVRREQHIKWLIVITYVIGITVVFCTIYINGLLYWVIPITIAALYYDVKFIMSSLVLVLPGILIGEIAAAQMQNEFLAGFEWIPLHIGVYLSGLIVLVSMMVVLAKRTFKMLERSYSLTGRVQGYLDRNLETSQVVGEAIGVVNQTILETHHVIEGVGESIENIVVSSNGIIAVAHETENIVYETVGKIRLAEGQAKEIDKINNEIVDVTNRNKGSLESNVIKLRY